ncbi:MAG TPA: hypothetical protein VMG08_10120 [Allosphingosinicella sp.]|nr:hypothetical protein [Allosphingosinicella sp.]
MSTRLPQPGRPDQSGDDAGGAAPGTGIARTLRSAERQILGRPADPLSVSTSYVVLRNGIGALGLALPIVLILGGGLDNVQASLSAYYHFSAASPAEPGAGTMRDAYVGMLCAIGAFLFFYRGHSLQEDLALNVAGIASVLVALFPMEWPEGALPTASATARFHYGCAITFFVMLAYVCVFRARDTLCIVEDEGRRRRFGRIYLLLGMAMLATPATAVALALLWPAGENGYTTLIVEVAGTWLFAAYWLIKGFEIRSALRGPGG